VIVNGRLIIVGMYGSVIVWVSRCNSMGRCKGRCNSMGRCKGRCIVVGVGSNSIVGMGR
jgi:hypothetical protein